MPQLYDDYVHVVYNGTDHIVLGIREVPCSLSPAIIEGYGIILKPRNKHASEFTLNIRKFG